MFSGSKRAFRIEGSTSQGRKIQLKSMIISDNDNCNVNGNVNDNGKTERLFEALRVYWLVIPYTDRGRVVLRFIRELGSF